ncbi:MAG: hypothetical protein M3Y70_03215 [Pseudomonadota bacterium]|nr:hypothetical protein [Pseudomonadota bacterium]
MNAVHSFLAVAVLALAGCNSVASGNDNRHDVVADGSTFAMRPGQSVTLADHGVLRYERLVNDSRCMPDVQCIWAGDAELAFEWRAGSGPAEHFSLHTGNGAKSHALGERTLTLVTVARGPAPEAQLRIEL